MPSAPPNVLAFAASDPTGGAGLQADILTIASLGCHPLSVLTALSVQDTSGVRRLQAVDAALLAEQAQCLLAELPVAAFKVGVVASAANARAIGAILAAHPRVPVVLDPVLASGRGDALAGAGVPEALCEQLMPRTTVLTPNTIEAAALGGVAACLARGCRYVLLTGTHADTPDVVNTLHDAGGVVREDRWPRLAASYHGSGCTLAAALAARLALGDAVPQAARAAQDATWRALERGFKPGRGQHLPWR
ncbi:MAG TPA: hydroxymethylpyrimidine/phosphomethylpyrimidine kinase [Burkholderiales bacterium]|nr:hydroxymethylpyrimidine/phosphomethylpyrimidine kinase [Burkholderiales bacterium]